MDLSQFRPKFKKGKLLLEMVKLTHEDGKTPREKHKKC